ncbi:hypothetical protein [Nesterenkonia populi]|uniref:hypothetical protein n=1 Tax=Nesterenkonia populi TaxID=1591087 RepID=UPI0011BFA2A4|nr:hypothetical protein [Nesterenkonia populi]
MKRLRRGVFVDPEQWQSARLSERHRAFAAAVGLTMPTLAFCDVTALSLYGAPLLTWPRTVHCQSPHRSRSGRFTTPCFPLHVQHSPGALPGGASGAAGTPQGQAALPAVSLPVPGITYEDGEPVAVRVQSLPRVLISTLPQLPRQEAIVILDAVMAGSYVFGRAVTGDALDHAEALHRGRNMGEWRELRAFADPRSESVGESRSRVLFDELGFEPPELQKELHLPRIGRVRLDFFWDDGDAGVVCEFDGMIKYTRGFSGIAVEDAVKQEKLREDALRLMGLRVVRITWDDLGSPQELGRKLLAAGVPHRALRRFQAG